MTSPSIENLLDRQVLRFNTVAAVTHDCIVIRDSVRQSHTIILVEEMSRMKQVKTTYPALLVLASGLFLVSAATLCSKEGRGPVLPLALLGIAFAASYLLSRRARVVFNAGVDRIETQRGSLSDAASLMVAVRSAQTRLRQTTDTAK